jgi:hypothetical protein
MFYMNTFQHITYLFLMLAIVGCKIDTNSKIESIIDSTIQEIDTGLNKLRLQSTSIVNNSLDTETTTKNKIYEKPVSIYSLIVWDEKKKYSKIQGDTSYIINESGEAVIGQKFKIISNQLTELKLEQRYETSVTISGDGPHCDLLEWKHYQSDWLELKPRIPRTYQISDYSDMEKEMFPIINMIEFKEEIRKYCGEGWDYLVENITKPTQYPSYVGISKIYLRISGYLNGQSFTKIVILEVAMGC